MLKLKSGLDLLSITAVAKPCYPSITNKNHMLYTLIHLPSPQCGWCEPFSHIFTGRLHFENLSCTQGSQWIFLNVARCASASNLCWYAGMCITDIYNLCNPQGSLSTQGGWMQGSLAWELPQWAIGKVNCWILKLWE